MSKEISEESKFEVSIKTLGGLAVLIFAFVGMWFTLQAEIAEAKLLPIPPDPEVTKMEFDMKDQMIRQTILDTQEDMKEVKEDWESLDRKEIFNEQTQLIKEFNQNLPEAFANFIPNYKSIATVGQYFNSNGLKAKTRLLIEERIKRLVISHSEAIKEQKLKTKVIGKRLIIF